MGLFSFFSKKSKQEQPTQEQEKLQESSNVVEEVQKEQVKENIVTDKNTNSVVEEAPQDEVKEENTSDKDSQVEDKTESLDKEEIKDNVSEEKVLEVSNTTDTVSKEKVKLSFFERLKRTRENLAYGLSALVTGKKIDEELYEDLETALLTADLGVDTTNSIIEKLKDISKARELHDAGALKSNLKTILKDILKPCEQKLVVKKQGDLPYVILMVGVNGAGKTTTIGKLALKYKQQGLKVMLAAGDTFRAAAVEQLKEWGARTNTPVVAQATGSDSASVIYDALTSAKAHGSDVLICDTAGRLQNKDNLMEELKKIVRVMKKIDESVPHEVMLVLDATTGQNAMSQMKIFKEAVEVTGLTLTKLDGTAKGGVIFALSDKYQVPLRYVGIGEKTEDLREFDIDNFVDALID
jgi:fused signal recognition particle receptor